MAPSFPAAKRRELKAPPLELVICQVRFPTILSLLEKPPTEFQKALPELVVPSRRHTQNFHLNPNTGESRVERKPSHWAFEDTERVWTASLAPDFLSLETKRYKSFDDFIKKFQRILAVATEVYDLKVRERLGLRYVDHISQSRCPDLSEDWVATLNPELLQTRSFLDAGERLHATADYRFANEGRILAMKALLALKGFPGVNEDTLALDFDCYTEERGTFDDIEQLLTEFKAESYRAYRWAVGDLILEFEEAGT